MKTSLVTLLCFLLTSCAVKSLPEATPEAEQLEIVETTHNCQIIDVVIGRSKLGSELGQDLKFAMIDAKNKAARLGADSIRILGSDDVSTRAALSSPAGTVMLEALDCN